MNLEKKKNLKRLGIPHMAQNVGETGYVKTRREKKKDTS